uniref:Uncharacterized protein n=1 Tax=Arundo donax TaxID=35708 RepID=A0A0A9HMB0_ARUDO
MALAASKDGARGFTARKTIRMTTPATIRRMLKAKQTIAAHHIAGEVRCLGCRIIFEGAAAAAGGAASAGGCCFMLRILVVMVLRDWRW